MINVENLIHYIEHERGNYHGEKFDRNKFPYGKNVILLDTQKMFLENLVNGKVTDCPRCFGKTFLINLYAEYLNNQHDDVKYNHNIVADDYITCNEMISKGILSNEHIARAIKTNKAKAVAEYNLTNETVNKIENLK